MQMYQQNDKDNMKCTLFHNEYDIIVWKGMFSDKNRSMARLKASGINGIVKNGHHILWSREKAEV